jgi:GNAT superfamily N-acetyltransferase
MGWTFTSDIETYAAAVWDLLAQNPSEQTVALSVIEAVRAGHRYSEDGEMRFGFHPDGGAVSLTPPYELLLAAVPERTLDELIEAVEDVEFPGVNGQAETVDRFAARWTARKSVRVVPVHEMRLYRLGTPAPPDRSPPGRARPASGDDLDLAVRWLEAFQIDAGVPVTNVEPMARRAIADGRLWLWEDGTPRALAGRTPTAVAVARIAPVYTPPEHRRRGYGSAITAACTQDALDRGAEHVVLFTDLANPTSNSIYQQIGFRSVRDYRVIHFDVRSRTQLAGAVAGMR